MEVYATIFMIFVSHVLSSICSRQRGGLHIPHPKIRRIPIEPFQNHVNDEDIQKNIALNYLLSSTDRLRSEKVTNGDSERSIQYDSTKIINPKIPRVERERQPRKLWDYNAFMTVFQKMNSNLYRKKRNLVNERVLSSSYEPFDSRTTDAGAVLSETDKTNSELSSTANSSLKAWANRAKMKYKTVRPWNQFCLTCSPPTTTLKNNCNTMPTCTTTPSDVCVTTTCYRYPTKRKKNTKPSSSTITIATEEDQPWLFYVEPSSAAPEKCTTDKCSKKTTICKTRNKLLGSHFSTKSRSYIDKFLMKKPRMKKRNYFLASKSQLGILTSSMKKYDKVRKSRRVTDRSPLKAPEMLTDIDFLVKKTVDPIDNFVIRKQLFSRISKLKKRSLKSRNGQESSIVGLIHHFGSCNKDRNMTKGLPACQKACFLNLTDLVNAKTIKPPDYFKNQPSLSLCCEDDLKNRNKLSTSEDDLTNMLSSSTSGDDINGILSLSPYEDEDKNLKTSTGSRFNELEDSDVTTEVARLTDSGNQDLLYRTDDSLGVPGNSNFSVPTVFHILMQWKALPSTTVGSQKPKDKFYLKVLLTNKENVANLKGLVLEPQLDNDNLNGNPILRYIMKRRATKKSHPWDAGKFCPCSVGKKKAICCTDDLRGKKMPWASTCCYLTSPATGKSGKTSRSKATGNSTKSTSESDTSTTSINGISSDAPEAISSGTEASSNGIDGSLTGSVTSSDSATTSIATAKATATKPTKSRAKATNKRRKNTSISRKSSNKIINAKETTAPYQENIITVKPVDEKSSSKSPSSMPPSMNQETNLNFKNLINYHKSAFDEENILLVLRVPVSLAQKYSQNGDMGLFLPLSNTSFPKYIKPRSILKQLLPSLGRRTTIYPIHLVLTNSEEHYDLPTTSAYVGKIPDDFPPPLLTMNVHKTINNSCPSCLKKRKELVFQTSYGDKKANCIIDNNNLFYEEVNDDFENSNDPSTEECDGKYVSYLLKFPKERMSSTPFFDESHSTKRDLTVLRSHDSPPKYFIEVPELLASVMNLNDDTLATSFESIIQRENASSRLRSQQVSHTEKPIVLCLQPFAINGHNVYLPVNGINKHPKKKVKPPIYFRNDDVDDYSEDTPNVSSSSKPFISGFLGQNDSVLPFALVPAYLAMHPANNLENLASKAKSYTTNAQEDQKLNLDTAASEDSMSKDEEIALTLLLNNFPKEKKPLKHSKQVKGTRSSFIPKTTPRSYSFQKKLSRKPASGRSPISPDKPTFIILMKDVANSPFLDDSEFPIGDAHSSTLEQKGRIPILSLGEYLN